MSYYHLFRIAKEEEPKLVDAGWHIAKIDELRPEELEKTSIYDGKYIHRYIIPEEEAESIWIRVGNEEDGSTNWQASSENTLQRITDLHPDELRSAWEIQFAPRFDAQEYYIRQEYPQELNWVGFEIGSPSEIPKPKILVEGGKIAKLFSEIK